MSPAVKLLVFNAGSSSLKFELIEMAPGTGAAAVPGNQRRLIAGSFVDAADGSGTFVLKSGASAPAGAAPVKSLAEAATLVLDWLSNPQVHGRDLLDGLTGTVHRIVHGGAQFRATTALNDTNLKTLIELSPLAPLHNPPALSVIAAVRRKLGRLVLIGVFDTAYYAGLPEAAHTYAVPARWREEFGVRRYGFHGMAHQYLCQGARRLAVDRPAARIVSLQLGRGCSVTATAGGSPIATSMGFTPLEGLVMGTRSGDVDPGALLYVMERSGMPPAEMRRELNELGGLLGISDQTADMRDLLGLERVGSAAAALAIEVFCRRARQYLAAYIAELSGVDVIAFGGGIGENVPDIRRRILAPFAWSGIEIDQDANSAAVGREAAIDSSTSRAAVYVIPVDEASIMAAEATVLLRG